MNFFPNSERETKKSLSEQLGVLMALSEQVEDAVSVLHGEISLTDPSITNSPTQPTANREQPLQPVYAPEPPRVVQPEAPLSPAALTVVAAPEQPPLVESPIDAARREAQRHAIPTDQAYQRYLDEAAA